MATKFYYNEAKSKGGAQVIYGVPARDLTEAEFDALPRWLQAQVEDSPLYRKTNPNPEPKAANKPGDKVAGDAEEK